MLRGSLCCQHKYIHSFLLSHDCEPTVPLGEKKKQTYITSGWGMLRRTVSGPVYIEGKKHMASSLPVWVAFFSLAFPKDLIAVWPGPNKSQKKLATFSGSISTNENLERVDVNEHRSIKRQELAWFTHHRLREVSIKGDPSKLQKKWNVAENYSATGRVGDLGS